MRDSMQLDTLSGKQNWSALILKPPGDRRGWKTIGQPASASSPPPTLYKLRQCTQLLRSLRLL